MIWAGAFNKSGYGQTRVNGHRGMAHRLVWELVFGVIPSNMCVCHRCDVSLCINPDHLFLGTIADNNRDAAKKGRRFFNSPMPDQTELHISEELVRAWVREEQERIDTEKQEKCSHMVSGTLNEDKSVTCSDCKKVLVFDPDDTGSMVPDKATSRYFGGVRK